MFLVTTMEKDLITPNGDEIAILMIMGALMVMAIRGSLSIKEDLVTLSVSILEGVTIVLIGEEKF